MLRIIILISALIAVKGDGCVPRPCEGESIVCVCNATYCDTINEPNVQQNQFLWYTSTQDGKRMQLSVNNFSAKNGPDNNIAFLVDSSEKYQQIYGFGGAMTDAAALNIRSLSNDTQRVLLESYFGPTGIGYRYIRIPIAGTDFSTRNYTYDDTPGDLTLSNFSLVDEDAYKIGYLKDIIRIMPNPEDLRIFTTAWSAPAWMKNTHDIKWGTLEPEYYQLYADYIRKFFDAYKEHNINIWGITPGNEPLSGFFPLYTFNAMGWSPNTAANWSTQYLAPTLTKAGYKLVYMTLDDQRFEIPWYPDIMFRNPKAKTLFSGTALHWYFDQLFSPIRLTQMHDMYPEKFILITEACTGSEIFARKKVILGSWERGERYATNIIENLSHWAIGWVDWNIALNEHGGPNWANNFVDSPIIVMPQNDEFYKQPMFYAMSHFSKFIPRDSFRISSVGLQDNKDIKAIAFLTPEQKIVTVIVNKKDIPVPITMKDTNTGNKINLQLPAKSFNTLIYLQE